MTTDRFFPRRLESLAISLVTALSLAACGGGGSDTENNSPATTDSATSATSATNSQIEVVSSASQSSEQHSSALSQTSNSALVVRARGALLNNTGPIIQVVVNGQVVASTEVRATAYQDYSFSIPSMSKGGTIDIVYTNDQISGGVDRNLWLQSITVDGAVTASTAAGVVYDQGVGTAAFDGLNVLPGQEGMFWNGAMRFKFIDNSYAISSTGYFVDQVGGSDGNPGTQALPWKTLAKVASSARVQPGQGIYLRCGQTWRESLTLNATQLADGTVISGYGAACATSKAVISGADDFSSGWTKSGTIWSRSVPAGTPKISRLFVNGVAQMTARWPNKPASGEGYALVASNATSSTNAIKVAPGDLAALSGRDLSNAVVNVRDIAWNIETFAISAYDSAAGSLKLNGTATYSIDPGEGYVLQDKLWMLDAPGEFFHDTAANKLYLYPSDSAAQANLNGQLVEGSVRDTPVSLSQRASLTVTALAARMGRVNGVTLTDVPGAIVDTIESSNNAGAGISLTQDVTKPAPTVRNSSFAGNWSYGIDARYAGAATISGNLVTDTGTIGNPGWSAAAIQGGDGANISTNMVNGSAYHGIRFSGTGKSVVHGNTVTNYCLRLSDCGGIYTWNGPKATGANQASTVDNNQVLAAKPNTDGAAGPGITVVAGIMLDDFSYGVTVRSNMAYGMPVGISVHNGSHNTLDSNRVWLATQTGICASMDQNDSDWMTSNVFKYNQIVPLKTAVNQFPAPPTFSEAYPIWFFDNLSGGSSITTGSNQFIGNQVVRLDGNLDDVHIWIRSNTSDTKLSSKQWVSFNPADAPTLLPMTFALYSLVLGPELVPGGSFDNGIGNWASYFNPAGSGGSLKSDSGKAGCTGNCITLTAGTNTDYAASPAFTMKANTQYLYSYTATLGGNATIRYPYVSQMASPWGSMAATGYTSSVSLIGTTGQVINYQAFFTAVSGDQARVNLQLSTLHVPVTFDNVSVKEITGDAFSSTSDWAVVAYAPVTSPTTVTCASLGWGNSCSVTAPDGTAIALPQTLAAGTSQLYLRADSAWRR